MCKRCGSNLNVWTVNPIEGDYCKSCALAVALFSEACGNCQKVGYLLNSVTLAVEDHTESMRLCPTCYAMFTRKSYRLIQASGFVFGGNYDFEEAMEEVLYMYNMYPDVFPLKLEQHYGNGFVAEIVATITLDMVKDL